MRKVDKIIVAEEMIDLRTIVSKPGNLGTLFKDINYLLFFSWIY